MKTTDVCKLDFPPTCYGETLEEIESTIQTIVESIFRDASGLMISGVNATTMKPLRPEEVTGRQWGIGGWWENAGIPREFKNTAMTFENSHQTAGKYLDGLVDKYVVTGDPKVLGYAKGTVKATVTLWETAAATHGYGKGWLPKPYAGLDRIAEMYETSVDQYSDITFGLEKYYRELATPEEKVQLAELFLSFADWWIDHNYTTSFMGRTVWWDRVHVLAQAYFLYLFQLAHSLAPRKKYLEGFDYIFSLAESPLVSKEGPYDGENFNPNASGIVVEAMSRIACINPSLSVFCNNCIRNYVPALIDAAVKGHAGGIGPLFNLKLFGAKYLTHAQAFSGDDTLATTIVDFLSSANQRTQFYHVRRGLDLDDPALSRYRIDRDDYRDVFWAEEHCAWLAAYWYLRRAGKLPAQAEEPH